MFAGTHVRYTRDVGVVRYELRNDHSTAASTDSLWRRQIHNEIRKRFQNTAAFAVSILPIDPAHHECAGSMERPNNIRTTPASSRCDSLNAVAVYFPNRRSDAMQRPLAGLLLSGVVGCGGSSLPQSTSAALTQATDTVAALDGGNLVQREKSQSKSTILPARGWCTFSG